MALVSPGVQVSVIDESFYTPAEPGTTPMIFVVSATGKKNARKIKLTPSQVAIAKRLNVPLEEYAKHIEQGV